MYCVSVMYPHQEGIQFDFDYYCKQHIPMALEPMGDNLVKSEVVKGMPGPDGSPPAYVCIGNIWIKSLEAFQGAMASSGEKTFADIPNFTNVQPIVQVNEVLAI